MKKILFIENHEVFARVSIQQFLQEYEVTVAPDRTSVDKLLQTNSFDIFLVDYDLDDCKGDTIVQMVRDISPQSLVIGVSSKDSGNEKLLAAGATSVCKKSNFAQLPFLLFRLLQQ